MKFLNDIYNNFVLYNIKFNCVSSEIDANFTSD